MRIAPKVHAESVLVSDLIDPPLSLKVAAVLGYNPDHDAWHVGVDAALCSPFGCKSRDYVRLEDRGDATLWTRRRGDAWVLYDVSSPLPAPPRA